MIRVLTLVLALCFTTTAFAKPRDQFIRVSPKLEIFVRHTPATPGKSTLVVLNGLTHTTENWSEVLKKLRLNGMGLLQLDLEGQGETLANHGAVTDIIRYQNQSEYIVRILSQLKIQKRVSVLGLSYGGGIAAYFATQHPNMVDKVILLAPYTEPQPEQDRWIRDQVAANRVAFPYNPASDDELYDYYLKQLIYSTYPSADPTLLTIPYKLESVYQMARGIRKLHLARYISTIPSKSVYLVGGDSDQLVKPYILDKFWKALPARSKASRLVIKRADHDLSAVAPKTIAWWVELILSNSPQTLNGSITTVDLK